MSGKKKLRWKEHYNSEQKILLVGEGDFSFSACLAKAFCSGINMVATSLHSQEELVRRHWSSADHLEKLERLGCLVIYGVDVYGMRHHPTLKDKKFDVVIFNFPHAGHIYGFGERDEYMITRHKELLLGFFKNAKELLEEDGEVHVTHREDDPYDTWGVKELAENAGLYMKEKVFFKKDNYIGYHNKRGGSVDDNKKFPIGSPFTFKFAIKKTIVQNKIEDDKIDGQISGDVDEVTSALLCLQVADDQGRHGVIDYLSRNKIPLIILIFLGVVWSKLD